MESSRSQGNADGASSLTGSRVCSSAAGWGAATSLPQHPANLGQFLLPTATQQRERAPNPVGEEWEGRGGCRAWPRRPIEDLGPECSLKDPTFSSKADRGQQVRDEFFARKTNLKLSLTCLCGRVIRCSPAFGEEERCVLHRRRSQRPFHCPTAIGWIYSIGTARSAQQP